MFEPIAGSMAAVALLDPAFKLFRWTYKKYRLTKEFGYDFLRYTSEYKAAVWNFETIRDHNIFLLQKRPLNEKNTGLDPIVSERLLFWVEALEKCEDLIKECDPHAWAEDDTGNANSGVNTPLAKTPGQNDPSTPLTSPAQAPNSLFPPLVAAKIAKLDTEVETHKRKRSSVVHHFFSRDKKPDLTKPSAPASHFSSSVAENSTFQPSETASTAEITQAAGALQKESTVKGRLTWATGGRARFLELLDELQGYYNWFSNAILLNESHERRQNPRELVNQQRRLRRATKIGMHLKTLIQALSNLQDAARMNFELMLHFDPFQLQLDIQKRLASLEFRSKDAAFHMQLKSSQASAASLEPVQTPPPANRSFLFTIQSEADFQTPTTPLAELHPNRRITGFAQCIDTGVAHETKSGWAHKLGHILDEENPDTTIRVFFDSTPWSLGVTLKTSLSNPAERQLLHKSEHAGTRARLARVIAASFMHCIMAESPQEFESQSLQYYVTQQTIATDPKTKWINPYIKLCTLGEVSRDVSAAAALTSAATSDSVDVVMVRKLGVLLCEVGVWEPITGVDLAAQVRTARQRKADLMKSISPTYSDVVHNCLEFKSEAENLGAWVDEHVVGPLKGCVDFFSKPDSPFA